MKEIKLKNNQKIKVDDNLFDHLNQWKWGLNSSGYARRTIRVKGTKKYKTLLMHRYILNITNNKITVDHINSNKLDNRLENLRTVTISNNLQRRTKETASCEESLGILYCRYSKDGIRFSFGRVKTKKEAEKIKDMFTSVFFDELAKYNNIQYNKLEAINYLLELTQKRLENKCNTIRIDKCIKNQIDILIDIKKNFSLDKEKPE